MVLLSDLSSAESSSSDSIDELSDAPESENEFDETGVIDEPPLPPSKRQKVVGGSRASSAVHIEPEPEAENDLIGDISSDTSGDVPNSPINAKLDEEEFQEQVTVCAWDGCSAGDLGNMDKLVEHIHNDHIESRQKKYTCEWNGCTRKSMAHASGYALKAHMRSHTREKPFYCYLPECDRAFTRSDALAKHMRTVHETEALRPSDPVPKSMQSSSGPKGKPLKIILKTPQSHSTGHDDSVDDGDGSEEMSAEFLTQLTEKHGFTSKELAMDTKGLYQHLVLGIRYYTAETESLRHECKDLEEKYRQEWIEKEVLLGQMAQVEEDWWQRRKVVLAAEAQKQAELDELARKEEEEEAAAAAAEEAAAAEAAEAAEAAAEAEGSAGSEPAAASGSPDADVEKSQKSEKQGSEENMDVASDKEKEKADDKKAKGDENGDVSMAD